MFAGMALPIWCPSTPPAGHVSLSKRTGKIIKIEEVAKRLSLKVRGGRNAAKAPDHSGAQDQRALSPLPMVEG
jgi:hypothetical protein